MKMVDWQEDDRERKVAKRLEFKEASSLLVNVKSVEHRSKMLQQNALVIYPALRRLSHQRKKAIQLEEQRPNLPTMNR